MFERFDSPERALHLKERSTTKNAVDKDSLIKWFFKKARRIPYNSNIRTVPSDQKFGARWDDLSMELKVMTARAALYPRAILFRQNVVQGLERPWLHGNYYPLQASRSDNHVENIIHAVRGERAREAWWNTVVSDDYAHPFLNPRLQRFLFDFSQDVLCFIEPRALVAFCEGRQIAHWPLNDQNHAALEQQGHQNRSLLVHRHIGFRYLALRQPLPHRRILALVATFTQLRALYLEDPNIATLQDVSGGGGDNQTSGQSSGGDEASDPNLLSQDQRLQRGKHEIERIFTEQWQQMRVDLQNTGIAIRTPRFVWIPRNSFNPLLRHDPYQEEDDGGLGGGGGGSNENDSDENKNMDNTIRPDNDTSSSGPVSEFPSNNSPVPTNNDAMDLDEHNHQDPPPAQTPPDHVQSLDSTQHSIFPPTSMSLNIKRDIVALCVSRQLSIQDFLRKIQTRERFIIFDAQKEIMRHRAEWILDALSKLKPKLEVIQMTREPTATQRLGNIREVIREGLINAGLPDPLNEERINLEFGQMGSQGDEPMDTDLDIDLDDDPETPKTPRKEYWSG